MTRVVVTGMGAISPAGLGLEALWDGVAGGPVNVARIAHFDASRATTDLAGLVAAPGFSKRPGDPDRNLELAREAVRQALVDAGRDAADACLVLETTDAGGATIRSAVRNGVAPSAACLSAMLPQVLAAELGIRGPALLVANASAAGAAALAVAGDLIGSGTADAVVVCGVDSVSETAFYGLSALRTLSVHGCRPFSARRSGIRVSEAAGAMVLEAGHVARARNARARADLVGWGVSNRASQFVRPEAGAIALATRAALDRAGMGPRQIGYINAHAAGTVQGDLAEVDALREVFREELPRVPLTSSKGALGHCQGAAGTIEAIVTVLSVERCRALPTVGLLDVDPAWADLNLGNAMADADVAAGLTISCGLGGANAALVFARTDG